MYLVYVTMFKFLFLLFKMQNNFLTELLPSREHNFFHESIPVQRKSRLRNAISLPVRNVW